ncbi:MAG: hypothetical protein QOE93_2438 [Actinomycetota bacterium]|jgi:hypothetical protein|nr:hypothetical protein [Actinomycetota bacterium]
MDVAPSVLMLVGLGLLLPAGLGVIAAVIYRATRTNLPPDVLQRKTRNAFWIASTIALAIELILFGLCLSALNSIG